MRKNSRTVKNHKTLGELYLGNENLKQKTAPKFKKITKSGSLTIPYQLRRTLGINPMDEYEVKVDETTGDITLKRIKGIDALSPSTEMLFNYNGRKVSMHSALELYEMVEEIIRCLNKYYDTENIDASNVIQWFDKCWIDGDSFETNPAFEKSHMLCGLEDRNKEILEAKELKEQKEKVTTSKKAAKKSIEQLNILDRVTEEEAKKYFKVAEYRKLKKQYNK